MAFEAVDACFGTPHISSDDLAALNEATIGKRDCVMKWGDDFKAVMTNANTCLVGTGSNSRTGSPALMPSRGMRQSLRSFAVVAGSSGVPATGVPLMTTGLMLSMPALVFA